MIISMNLTMYELRHGKYMIPLRWDQWIWGSQVRENMVRILDNWSNPRVSAKPRTNK